MSSKIRLAGISALVILLGSGAAFGQMRPPTVSMIAPHGGQRGTTITFAVEGSNLTGASQILFDDPSIKGKILNVTDQGADKIERRPGATDAPIDDVATRNQVAVEVSLGANAMVGRHTFRLSTPLGTTNLGVFWVGALPEVSEIEPNNSPASAQQITTPVTINGVLEMANDVDYYRLEAKAGQQLVFEVVASAIRSNLDSTLSLLDDKGRVLASNDGFNGKPDSLLAYTFPQSGSYVVRISDVLNGGSKRHFYRLTIGELPYVKSVFPLGASKTAGGEIALEGFNLGDAQKVRLAPSKTDAETIPLPITTARGEPLNKVRIALGNYPEITEQEPNDDLSRAQEVMLPVTINGRIGKENGDKDQDVFRFKARKGQRIVFSVMAQRLGSPLDSVIEVLDAKGVVVPRATLRPIWQTAVTLRDHNSADRGIRLESWSGIKAGDFVLIGNELLQVEELPKHPDADVVVKGYRGRRAGMEDTTPEGHALNSPVYRVEIHKPGAEFPPNGMPTINLVYRNDDGGPLYGKDSHLTFIAPEDGQYYVRIRDVRGHSDKQFAYRLTIAEPDPGFALAVSPSNPNVPRGGRVPVTVFANRIDGFDGRIDVQITDLPDGLRATTGTILPGHNSVVLTLSASDNVSLNEPVALRVRGRAEVNGREVIRNAVADEPISLISVSTSPDLYITSVEPQELTVEPGGRVRVSVKIKRANGFEGRVPISVQNLPFLLGVPDIGLNGILITEKEEGRDFYIVADPRTEPLEQTIYVTGRVETNSSVASEHASVPIKLKVVPKRSVATR